MLSVLAVAAALALQQQVPTRSTAVLQRPTMPSVVNRTVAEATRMLSRYPLRIDTSRIAGPPSRALLVLRQFPDSGAPITRETVVRLVVSMIAVPDVRGFTEPDVEKSLASVRLREGRTTIVPVNAAPGTAVRQSPAARALVEPGVAVDVYYAAAPPAPPPVLMPSVIDFTLDAATAIIGQFGLRIDTLREAGPPERGTRIVKQAPEPGTPITKATRATIVVSMIAVPDFIGMTEAQAARTIKTNLLRLGAVSTAVANGDSGTVTRQGISPGELVIPGTLIDLIYIQPEPQTPTAPPPVQPTPAAQDTTPPTQPTSIDTSRNQPITRVDTARITIPEPAPPPRRLEATNGSSIPVWAWIAGGLLLLLGAAATIRNRLAKRERELVDRAKMLVTVSPAAPFTPRVNVRSEGKHTSIRYMVSDGQTRISVRADVPFVIKEERTHV